MPETIRRKLTKLIDTDPKREGYLLNQKAHNYIRKLQLEHALKSKDKNPLKNQLLLPGKAHPLLTHPVYFGESGEPIVFCMAGDLGKGSFGGVYAGVNLDTGEPRAVKIQFPKTDKQIDDLLTEGTVLQELNRYDDRIQIKDTTIIQDFNTFNQERIYTEAISLMHHIDEIFEKLGIMKASEFKKMVLDLDIDNQQIIDAIMEGIKNTFPKFEDFKEALLKEPQGVKFLTQILQINTTHFKDKQTESQFQEILEDSENANFSTVIENAKYGLHSITDFMEISAQSFAYGQNLTAYLDEKHTEQEKLDIAIKILEGIEALHRGESEKPGIIRWGKKVLPEEAKQVETSAHGFVHRDLKAANVMWDPIEKKIKIVDFGFTRKMNADKEFLDERPVGTPGAMAPEILIAWLNGEKLHFNPLTDAYAAAVILLELYSPVQVEIPIQANKEYKAGALEQAKEVKKLFTKNKNHSGTPPVLTANLPDILSNTGNPVYEVIQKMLDVNPEKRMPIPDALKALKQIRLTMPEVTKPRKKTSKAPQPMTFNVRQKNAEQDKIRENLNNFLDSFQRLHEELHPTQTEPKMGERRSYMVSDFSSKEAQKTEIFHWVNHIQTILMKSTISNEDLNSLAKDIDTYLKIKKTEPDLKLEAVLEKARDDLRNTKMKLKG